MRNIKHRIEDYAKRAARAATCHACGECAFEFCECERAWFRSPVGNDNLVRFQNGEVIS